MTNPKPERDLSLKWTPAPTTTRWGSEMMVADIELDKDSTLTLYCAMEDLDKVPAVLRSLGGRDD